MPVLEAAMFPLGARLQDRRPGSLSLNPATCFAPAPTFFPGHGLLGLEVNKFPAALGHKGGWP